MIHQKFLQAAPKDLIGLPLAIATPDLAEFFLSLITDVTQPRELAAHRKPHE